MKQKPMNRDAQRNPFPEHHAFIKFSSTYHFRPYKWILILMLALILGAGLSFPAPAHARITQQQRNEQTFAVLNRLLHFSLGDQIATCTQGGMTRTLGYLLPDNAREAITNFWSQLHNFKVPDLKNVTYQEVLASIATFISNSRNAFTSWLSNPAKMQRDIMQWEVSGALVVLVASAIYWVIVLAETTGLYVALASSSDIIAMTMLIGISIIFLNCASSAMYNLHVQLSSDASAISVNCDTQIALLVQDFSDQYQMWIASADQIDESGGSNQITAEYANSIDGDTILPDPQAA